MMTDCEKNDSEFHNSKKKSISNLKPKIQTTNMNKTAISNRRIYSAEKKSQYP